MSKLSRNVDDLPDVVTITQIAHWLSISSLTIKRMIAEDRFQIKAYWKGEPHRSKRVFLKSDIIKVFLNT